MSETEAAREARIRRLARKFSFTLRKARYRNPELRERLGGYMLVDAWKNTVMLGASPNAFAATLDDVESFFDEESDESPVEYEIVDPRPTAQRNPATFWVPSDEMLAAIAPGDLVKVMFAPAMGEGYGG